MTIGDAVMDNRADAARAIGDATTWQHSPATVAHLPAEGLQIRSRPEATARGATYELAGADGARFGGYGQALVEDRFAISEVVGALTRLDNRARALPGHLAELEQRRAGVDDRIAAASETADRPFPTARNCTRPARPSRRSVPASRSATARSRRCRPRFRRQRSRPPAVARPGRRWRRTPTRLPAAPPGASGEAPPHVRRRQPPGRGFGR